jgi:hypothetical protein
LAKAGIIAIMPPISLAVSIRHLHEPVEMSRNDSLRVGGIQAAATLSIFGKTAGFMHLASPSCRLQSGSDHAAE